MEKIDEENELGPTGESNNSQETDEGSDTNNSDSASDSSEQGDESLSFDSSSAVLVSEIGKVEGENIQTGDQDREGSDQEELERAIEKELEEGVKDIDKYFEEEAEFIKAYQEMVGKERALDEVRKREGESRQMTDEEWEKEVEIAAYNAELIYESVEKIETIPINEEIPENKEELEIEKEVEQSEEISEPQLSDLKEEVQEQEQELEPICEGKEPLEQHQVEPYIKEALETEQENVIKEKELEQYQELELEEQFKTINFNEFIEELVEKQYEETEQLKEQEEKEALEAQASKIKEANSELYEVVEVERDKLDQHEVEATIEEELETEPEPIIIEKEVEKLQELDIEEQFQMVHLNEYVDELVEKQVEDKNNENDKIEQEKENIEQTQEVVHKSTYLQEKLEEQEEELEWEYKGKDRVEQHQVEGAIEEELKTEPKPIVNEEELEYIKNLEPEKQLEAELFYEFIEELANKQNEEKEEREENEEQEEISAEQKVAQIMRELDIPQEITSSGTEVENNSQERELEQETTSTDEELVEQLEIEESKDHQQELEEILEQVRKIEQEALSEIGQEKEDLDKSAEKIYERAKNLYKQQTGKRPIYASKETKGFKQWLEKEKKSEEKEKTKQKKELKEEQKKEEVWKRTLKRWIKEASEEECNAELKSELKKALESYNEFEYLTRKFLELYKKSQHEKLTEIEKNRLKTLRERLQGLGPIQLELLANIRAFNFYFNNNLWQLMNRFFVNRVRIKFFKHISQKYKKLRKEQKTKEKLEEILKHWIEQASEGEISPELKVLLKEIVENYIELEELAIRFMELYKKEQFEQISQSEKVELKSLIKTLEKLCPINIVLFANIRAIKCYLNDQHLSDFSAKTRINRVISKFFKHISQEYNRVILEYEDFKYTKQEINLRENNNTFEEKLQFNKSEIKVTNQEKALIREEDSAGIPIQRILEKINTHKENIKNDFYFKKSFSLFPTSKVTLTPHKQSSVGRKKNISIDINNLNFHNLLDELLLKSYEEFYIEHFTLKVKNPYANTGRTLRAVFINWIKERYSNDNPKKDILLEKINNINENEEIAQYILYLLINSNVTQIGLNSILLKFHLNVSRETVRTIAKKNFTNEDYKKKFSKGDGWNKFSLQNSENYKKLIFSSLLNKELHKFFEQYYMNTGNYANFGKKITKNFIDWIKQRNIDASKKKDVFELIENINENKEILNYIIYHVKNYINSNSLNKLPLKVFSNKFTPLFLTVSDLTIQRIITKHIFQGNINEFRKLFPVGGRKKKRIVDFVNLSFDSLLNSSLIDRFRVYKEIFYTSTNHIFANHGMEITEDFIKWININECDITEKENLINLCKKINENEEILSFIIHLTLNTNYNLSEIARELNLINLNGQRNTITRIVKEYIFNFDKEEFDNRFHASDIVSQTGLSTHLCLNSLISLFFNKNGIYRYYSEIRIFPPSNKQADGFFLNFKFSRFLYDRLTKFEDSERLIKALNIKKDLLKKVVGVQIEFTSDLSDENILSKCTKYQNNSILLIIVGTNWKDKNNNRQIVPNISEILYPDKVLIINPELFTKLLNFDSSFIQEFNKILEYSKNSDIESLERYNDNIYHRITFYDTNDLIKDIELQFFEKYFYDPEIELNEMEIPQLFSKFITYCKDNSLSLEIKTITRGSFIGKYCIFNTIHLRQFIYQINRSYNLVNLAEVLGNYIGQDNIFFKKITYLNSAGKLKDSRRGILIKYSFLNNYQEEF